MKNKTCALVEVASRGLNDIHKFFLVRENCFLDFFQSICKDDYMVHTIHARGLKKPVDRWFLVSFFANGPKK